jgi:hypothetical protein
MSWKSTSAFYLMAALKIPAMKRPKTPGKFSAKCHHIIWSQLVIFCNLFSDKWVAVGILGVDSETNENAKCNDQGKKQAKIYDRPI